MKSIKRIQRTVSVVMAILLVVGSLSGLLAGCGGKYDDYYTFSVGEIPNEMLVNTSQKLDPVVRNLGEVIENPDYSVEILNSDGEDVTSDTYDGDTKLFTPSEIGEYSVRFMATDEKGTPLENSRGERFVKTVQINVVALDIEPVTEMDESGVTIDHDNISITFDESLQTPREEDVKQYKLTGVTFSGNFRLAFDVSELGFSTTQDSPKIFVGFKRDTIEREDDSFGFDPKNKTFSSWMKGVSAGDGWKNTVNGWMETENRVQHSDGVHEICISRFINRADEIAYWTIEYDGEAVNYINAGKEYTDNVVTVYFTTSLVSGTIGNISFVHLDTDEEAPTIETGTNVFGRDVDLAQCAVVTDNQTGLGFCTVNYTVKDAVGNVLPTDGAHFIAEKEGNYLLHVACADLVGNAQEADIPFRCGAMVDLSALPSEYIVNTAKQISFLVENEFADIAKGQVQLKICLDTGEAVSAVSGSYLKGDLTVRLGAEGNYTMQIFYRGNMIAEKEIAGVASATKSPEIDFEDMTHIARTHLGHGVYFRAYDAVDGDISASATVKFAQASASGYQDVTETVYDAETASFRPNTAGTYSMTVSATNSAGKSAERSMTIRVRDDVQTIYFVSEIDYGIDMNFMTDASLSTTTVYRDGFRFANMHDGNNLTSPKFNVIPVGIEKNWSVYFEATDLQCAKQSDGSTPQAMLGMVLILGNSLQDKGLGFDTFSLGGKPNDDVWGWGSSVVGASSITYAWASWGNSWYDKPSHEFDPNGVPIPGGSHWTYLGEHSYRLRCRTSETGVVTYYTYIDEVLFAIHDTSTFLGQAVTAHDGFNQLLGFQFCSKFMEGTVYNIRIVNE